MSNPVTRFLDEWLGRGEAAVTVPAMDGALKPNNRLEDLDPGLTAPDADDAAIWQGAPVWSDGAKVVGVDGRVLADLGQPITAMAADGQGRLAVATADGALPILEASGGRADVAWSPAPRCVTAMAFGPDGALWICSGSDRNPAEEWRRDLMEKNRAGSLLRADPATGKVATIAKGLAWPAGVAPLPDGGAAVSEAWANQVVAIGADGRKRALVDDVPGYPGRLSPASGGGLWLSVFAPRSQLIEFVLREPAYRKAMMREVPEPLWVAPTYASGESFNEPLQGGALKSMGILKPWAPTRSYGLVVELDADFVPARSLHSRAGGRRHGVTAAVEHQGELWMACRGAGEILRAPIAEGGAA